MTRHWLICPKCPTNKEEIKERAILFDCGHSLMDLTGYDALLSGELTDYALPDDELKKFTDAVKDLLEAEMRKSGKW